MQCDGSGTCDGPVYADPNAACGDDTDNACTDPDTCDGMGICLDNHADPNTPCESDGDDCTYDFCDGSGVCAHVLEDIDEDGVCDPVENSCLFGDGGDAVDLATARYNTSLPTATGLGCVRVTSDCTQHRNVEVNTEGDLGDDPDFGYPFGLVHFELEGCPADSPAEADVTLAYDAATDLSLMTLRKHGPTTPEGSSLEFYTLEDVFGGANVIIAGN